jgi:hypothetical protein
MVPVTAPQAEPTPAELQRDLDSLADCFRCPISHLPLTDPVVDRGGHSYDRRSIARWLLRSHLSPLTREAMSGGDLAPNHSLRHCVEAAVQAAGAERRRALAASGPALEAGGAAEPARHSAGARVRYTDSVLGPPRQSRAVGAPAGQEGERAGASCVRLCAAGLSQEHRVFLLAEMRRRIEGDMQAGNERRKQVAREVERAKLELKQEESALRVQLRALRVGLGALEAAAEQQCEAEDAGGPSFSCKQWLTGSKGALVAREAERAHTAAGLAGKWWGELVDGREVEAADKAERKAVATLACATHFADAHMQLLVEDSDSGSGSEDEGPEYANRLPLGGSEDEEQDPDPDQPGAGGGGHSSDSLDMDSCSDSEEAPAAARPAVRARPTAVHAGDHDSGDLALEDGVARGSPRARHQ